DYGAREGEHSDRDSAANRFRHRGCDGIDRSPCEQRSIAGKGCKRGNAMDPPVVTPDVVAAALPHRYGSCAGTGAPVCLAAAGFSLGPAGAIFMGSVAAARYRWSGEACVQHDLLRQRDCEPPDWRGYGGRDTPGCLPHASDDAPYAGYFPEQLGPVDRLGSDCGISIRGDSSSALPGTELSDGTDSIPPLRSGSEARCYLRPSCFFISAEAA